MFARNKRQRKSDGTFKKDAWWTPWNDAWSYKMSNELNKTILFEGIESEQQLTILKKEGVDIIQGWLISKAIPLEEMASFTQAQTKTKEVVCS